MFGLSFGSKRQKPVAVAFAGSASAGCAIVVCGTREAPPRVLAYSYATLPVTTNVVDPLAITSLVNEVCTKASTQYAHSLHFKTHGAVHRTHGIVHAPWVTSRSERVDTVFERDVVVTEVLINELAQQALTKASGGNTLSESSVVRVELNGYATAQPKGRKAHRVSVAVLASMCEQHVYKGLTDALQHAFPVQASIRSDARALMQLVAPEAERFHDCFVIHVLNEATLCIVLRKGVPVEMGVVEVGVRSLGRAVGDSEEAFSLLRLAAKDLCQDDTCRVVETALAVAEPELAKKYGEAFALISKTRRIPENVVLVVHPDFASWFASFFARLDFAPFTVTTRPFQITVPSAFQTQSALTWTAGLREELALVESIAFVNSIESTA